MNAAPYPLQVQRVQRSYLEEERRFRRHVLALPGDALILEALDTVAWTSARHGYVEKLFEVGTMTDPLLTGTTRVALRERDSSDYSWTSSFEVPVEKVARGIAQVPPQTVTDFTAVRWIIPRADGTPGRPAIRITWDGDQDDVRGVQWEVEYPNGPLILAGSTLNVRLGEVILSDSLLFSTTYRLRARFIVDRPTIWTEYVEVTTHDIRVSVIDLADEVSDILDAVPVLEQELVVAAADIEELSVDIVEQADLLAVQRVDFDADVRRRIPSDRIVDGALESISARVTELLMRVSETQSTIARAGVYIDETDGSVIIEGVRNLEEALFDTRIEINNVAGQIGLFASRQFVQQEVADAVLDPSQIPLLSDIVAQLNEVAITLDAAQAAILAKADVSTVTAQGARLTSAELNISGLEGAVALKANTSEVSALDTRVTDVAAELDTIGGAALSVALSDVRTLNLEGAQSAAADLGAILRSHEERARGKADLAAVQFDLSAAVSDVREAVAQLSLELLAARDANSARFAIEAAARATADQAEAAARQQLAAKVDTDIVTTQAQVSAVDTARVNGDAALAQRASSLEARTDDLEGDQAATAATLTDLATTTASNDAALAQRVSRSP